MEETQPLQRNVYILKMINKVNETFETLPHVSVYHAVLSGLASLSFQLSAEPVLGDWKISALIGKKTEETKFTVDEYGEFYNTLSCKL